jgi:hypothetical protein
MAILVAVVVVVTPKEVCIQRAGVFCGRLLLPPDRRPRGRSCCCPVRRHQHAVRRAAVRRVLIMIISRPKHERVGLRVLLVDEGLLLPHLAGGWCRGECFKRALRGLLCGRRQTTSTNWTVWDEPTLTGLPVYMEAPA